MFKIIVHQFNIRSYQYIIARCFKLVQNITKINVLIQTLTVLNRNFDKNDKQVFRPYIFSHLFYPFPATFQIQKIINSHLNILKHCILHPPLVYGTVYKVNYLTVFSNYLISGETNFFQLIFSCQFQAFKWYQYYTIGRIPTFYGPACHPILPGSDCKIFKIAWVTKVHCHEPNENYTKLKNSPIYKNS